MDKLANIKCTLVMRSERDKNDRFYRGMIVDYDAFRVVQNVGVPLRKMWNQRSGCCFLFLILAVVSIVRFYF